MKKIIAAITLALVVALALPIALVGCKTNPYGTYKIYNLTFSAPESYDGSRPTDEELEHALTDMKEAGTTVTLNKNYTVVFHNFEQEGDVELTWKKENGKYHFYEGDHDVGFVGTVKNGKLTLIMEFDGAKESMIFKK